MAQKDIDQQIDKEAAAITGVSAIAGAGGGALISIGFASSEIGLLGALAIGSGAPIAVPAIIGAAAVGAIVGSISFVHAKKRKEESRRVRRAIQIIEESRRAREAANKPKRNRKPKQKKEKKRPKQRPVQVKPAKPVCEMKENEIDEYHLKNMLVVIICVSEYDGALADLPGTRNDLRNLVTLFSNKYKYKGFYTTKPRVTYDDMDLLLNEARVEFMKNEYDGIIVCFSGHGTETALLCSDHDHTSNKGAFPRKDFNQWFDGNHCKSRVDKYKFYFLDACRGNDADIAPIRQDVNTGTRSRGNMASSSLKSASENTCYMYGNSNWSVTLETKAGGMLTSAVVDAFKSNLAESIAIGPLQSNIRKIAKGYGNHRDGVILPTVENNIDHEIMGKITFGPKIRARAQRRGIIQDISIKAEQGLTSDYVRMFNTINWRRKMSINDKFGEDDPYYHLLCAIKEQTGNTPSRIRNRDGFINALKKVKRFRIIDGYDILGDNFYSTYKTFIDANLKSDNAFNEFNYWKKDYNYLDQDLPDIE